MKRPSKFESQRYLGDKRKQVAYDLEESEDSDYAEKVMKELMDSEKFLCFAPDTASEVRNRGYKVYRL